MCLLNKKAILVLMVFYFLFSLNEEKPEVHKNTLFSKVSFPKKISLALKNLFILPKAYAGGAGGTPAGGQNIRNAICNELPQQIKSQIEQARSLLQQRGINTAHYDRLLQACSQSVSSPQASEPSFEQHYVLRNSLRWRGVFSASKSPEKRPFVCKKLSSLPSWASSSFSTKPFEKRLSPISFSSKPLLAYHGKNFLLLRSLQNIFFPNSQAGAGAGGGGITGIPSGPVPSCTMLPGVVGAKCPPASCSADGSSCKGCTRDLSNCKDISIANCGHKCSHLSAEVKTYYISRNEDGSLKEGFVNTGHNICKQTGGMFLPPETHLDWVKAMYDLAIHDVELPFPKSKYNGSKLSSIRSTKDAPDNISEAWVALKSKRTKNNHSQNPGTGLNGGFRLLITDTKTYPKTWQDLAQIKKSPSIFQSTTDLSSNMGALFLKQLSQFNIMIEGKKECEKILMYLEGNGVITLDGKIGRSASIVKRTHQKKPSSVLKLLSFLTLDKAKASSLDHYCPSINVDYSHFSTLCVQSNTQGQWMPSAAVPYGTRCPKKTLAVSLSPGSKGYQPALYIRPFSYSYTSQWIERINPKAKFFMLESEGRQRICKNKASPRAVNQQCCRKNEPYLVNGQCCRCNYSTLGCCVPLPPPKTKKTR